MESAEVPQRRTRSSSRGRNSRTGTPALQRTKLSETNIGDLKNSVDLGGGEDVAKPNDNQKEKNVKDVKTVGKWCSRVMTSIVLMNVILAGVGVATWYRNGSAIRAPEATVEGVIKGMSAVIKEQVKSNSEDIERIKELLNNAKTVFEEKMAALDALIMSSKLPYKFENSNPDVNNGLQRLASKFNSIQLGMDSLGEIVRVVNARIQTELGSVGHVIRTTDKKLEGIEAALKLLAKKVEEIKAKEPKSRENKEPAVAKESAKTNEPVVAKESAKTKEPAVAKETKEPAVAKESAKTNEPAVAKESAKTKEPAVAKETKEPAMAKEPAKLSAADAKEL